MIRTIVVSLTVLLLLGCASTGEMASSGKSRYVITGEEIAGSSARTAWDAVEMLRPDLLRMGDRRSVGMTEATSGPDASPRISTTLSTMSSAISSQAGNEEIYESSSEVAVYVDGVRYGSSLGDLKSINAHDVAEIRYMRASEATIRYGTGHGAGAFLITLKPN